jgi:hypothetical protein
VGLHYAAYCGNKELARVLIQDGPARLVTVLPEAAAELVGVSEQLERISFHSYAVNSKNIPLVGPTSG